MIPMQGNTCTGFLCYFCGGYMQIILMKFHVDSIFRI
jgi:hypothetical protein